MGSEALIRMAIRSQTDDDAIPVLGDMLIEASEVDRVKLLAMALLIGVPLDSEIPERLSFKGQTARDTYRAKRSESLRVCVGFWDQYSNAGSRVWARAVLAVLLFRGWRPATSASHGWVAVPTNTGVEYRRTRSPWAVIREPANRQAREAAADRRAYARLQEPR